MSTDAPKQLPRFLVATIAHDGRCDMFYVNSLCESAKALLSHGIILAQVIYTAEDSIMMATNRAITDAFNGEFDGLILVSPNVSWEPQALFDLINSDKDCVGLPVCTNTGFKVALGDPSRIHKDEQTGEVRVVGVTTDFLYLSGYAIKELCSTHPTIKYLGVDVKLVLQSGDIFNAYLTVDEILNSRISELNMEPWLNINHVVSSRNTTLSTGDFVQALNGLT